jgi:outer membrane protein TolC
MQRFGLLLILTAVCGRAGAGPDLPAQLTLRQALDIALSNSINIRTAIAHLEQASGVYEQSRSALLPQLNVAMFQSERTIDFLGIGLDIPSSPGRVGPFGSMDARLYLTQDLLNLASVRAWQSSRAARNASMLLVSNAREFVVLTVVSAYLDALKAKMRRTTLASQVALAEELYNITRDRVSQGIAAELDANRAMQQVNALRQEWQEAEQSYITAKLNLANILQAHITSDFEVADDAAYGTETALNRNFAIQTALASRADYRSAAESVKAAELKVRSIRASRLPVVGLRANDGQSGNTPVNNVNTWTIQGVITFPVFTSGLIGGEIEEAEGELREAATALDQERSQIETDVLASLSGVEWALKEVQTSEGNVKLSRQEVELARSRFTQGIADNTEVVNAQDRLEKADEAHIRALFALGLARANLARATGGAEKTYRR